MIFLYKETFSTYNWKERRGFDLGRIHLSNTINWNLKDQDMNHTILKDP